MDSRIAPGDRLRRVLGSAVLTALLAAGPASHAQDADLEARGAYVFRAGNCIACHTERGGEFLAGGRALNTPFGTFYSPNITSDPEHGLGRWSEEDFIGAMRHGVSPDGASYFPVFPYTSFTNITDEDLRAMWAYLRTVPPVAKPDRAHEAGAPFGWRFLVPVWKMLNFTRGPFEPDPARSAEWNRGAYLVRALGHCGECHTPRNILGGTRDSMFLGGNADGPDGQTVPNITPDPGTGIGNWSEGDVAFMLKLGILPSGDVAGGRMAEVIEHSTSHLSDEDLAAIEVYLRSLRPLRHEVRRRGGSGGAG